MKIKYLFWWFFIGGNVLVFIGATLRLDHYNNSATKTLIGGMIDFAIAAVCFFYMVKENKKKQAKS